MRRISFTPTCDDGIPIRTVNSNCKPGECDCVICVTHRTHAYKALLGTGNYMASNGKSGGYSRDQIITGTLRSYWLSRCCSDSEMGCGRVNIF